MSSLVVGGVAIKVAVSSPRWTRSDAVDRARAFDNTFRASQTGGAVRVWDFETPAVLAATEGETYKAALSTVASQLCSGDILALPTMCSAELTDGVPTSVAGDPYVVLSFSLHEVQPAKTLLRYALGDTLSGETFTRASTAFYQNNVGVLVSVANNIKRDAHIAAGVRTLLLEASRINGFIRSQEFDNAAWTKGAATVTANAATAPDGTLTGDSLFETAVTAEHFAYQGMTTTANTLQPLPIYLKAGTRTWAWLRTNLRDGATPTSWINLATGAIGTKAAAHTIRVTVLASGWYRVEVVVNSATGGGATDFLVGTATGDNVSSFLGVITQGINVWGAQHEQDKPFASSYIPTTTVAVTRSADLYSVPFTDMPTEMTVYVKFVEVGGVLTASGGVFSIGSAAAAAPALVVLSTGSVYRVSHSTAAGTVISDLGAAAAIGDYVELVVRLYGDGSVQIAQSINSAVETSSATSAANALAAAWSDDILWLNSLGNTNPGFIALQSFKIVAGARSLAEMRAA